MTNERNQAADIQVNTGVKRIYQLLVILAIAVCTISASLYFLFRTPVAMNTGSPPTLETFSSQLEPLKTSIKIVGIGDSLTKGVGDIDEKGYAGMTVEALKNSKSISNVSFVDYGVRGDKTDDLLAVLNKEDVRKNIKDADIIFMTIGGNDIVDVLKEDFLGLKVKDFQEKRVHYQRNLNKILLTLNELNPNITIYYIGLYNPFEDLFPNLDTQFQLILQRWNQSSKTILELYPNTVFVPTADLFKDKSSKLLYTDHFHPNKKGYQLISKRLVSAIVNKK
jgi:lysophospholipase L1-like esterase